MTKITKEVLFTELSIKIAILEAKIDKLLGLAMKPSQEVEWKELTPAIKGSGELYRVIGNRIEIKGAETPPQWPNESRTDYLKRIGQWNVASSDDEIFLEENK